MKKALWILGALIVTLVGALIGVALYGLRQKNRERTRPASEARWPKKEVEQPGNSLQEQQETGNPVITFADQ